MSTTARYPLISARNQDNTGRILTVEYQAPVYAATIALQLASAQTIVKVAQLTGALTITGETTRPQIGDELCLLFNADGTNRIVTFGTGFASAGTLTVTANKQASATFCFDGTSWVEVGRAVAA
jgi:hypothetical protein